MKEVFKRVIPSFVLAIILTLTQFGTNRTFAEGVDTTPPVGSEEQKTVYTIMDNFKYQLSKEFELSPDSFEAWIKMPKESVGGTVMGNFTHQEMAYDGTVNWKIDALGRVVVEWNNKQFVHTFKSACINDGNWHHIAVIRNPQTHVFSLYIDARFKESVKCVQEDLNGALVPMTIGVDSSYSTIPELKKVKEPFEGYVRQITVYNGAISAERILSDMQNLEITDDYNGKIMGNWYFGDEWTERTVKDTTSNENNAFLATFDRYVGVANQNFEYDYTFAVIPDVQTCVRWNKSTYINAMRYLANNKEELNLQFALQVGDLSDIGSVESLYEDAAEGLSYLDGIVPYSFVPGNHDYNDSCHMARDLTYFNTHFSYEKHSKLPGFGGAFKEGAMENTYYLYKIGKVKYCVINLELAPRKEVIRWAGKICERYPDHRVIINTHAYIENSGEIIRDYSATSPAQYNWKYYVDVSSSQELYDQLIGKYENIFMAFCGHVASDDVLVRYDKGVFGNTVTSMLVNLQASVVNNGIGEDAILLIKVNEKAKKMSCYFYSPAHDAVYNLQNQFELSFNGFNSKLGI